MSPTSPSSLRYSYPDPNLSLLRPNSSIMSTNTPPSAGAHSSASSPITPNSNSNTNTKSTPGRKGKAVQWLDDHLNSQAAERALQQEHPSQGFGNVRIEEQSSSQAASQLARLKNLDAERRVSINSNIEPRELEQLELEGIKRRERELERVAAGEPPMSPHLLDEKGLDPNAFFELTTALERHQSQTSQTTPQPSSTFDPLSQSINTTSSIPASYSLPNVPPTAFPQSDMGTVEKSKAQQSPQSILASASGGPGPAPGSGPRVHYFPPRAQPPPGTMKTVKLPPIHTQPIEENHALTDFTSTSPPVVEFSTTTSENSPQIHKPLIPLSLSYQYPHSGPSGTYTPGTGTGTTSSPSTPGTASPDHAMRQAMLPIVPGEDLPPPLFEGVGSRGNDGDGSRGGGARSLWANLRHRTMKRTHDVPGAVIEEGESAGLPSRGRRRGDMIDSGNGNTGYDDGDVENQGDGEGGGGGDGEGIWSRLRNAYDDENHDDVEVHAEDVEAYATSRAKTIIRAHTRSRGKKSRFASKKSRSRNRHDTDTDGETDYNDDGGEEEKTKGKNSIWSVWQSHKATKTKDYGNTEIDRLGGDGAGGGSETGDSDVDSMSLGSSYMPAPSGGVLGALLALYNAQNDSSLDSMPPSGASTPAIQPESMSRSRTSASAAARRAAMQVERESRAEASDATKVDPGLSNSNYSESSPASTFVEKQASGSNSKSDSNDVSPPTITSPADDFRANAMSKQGITSTARKLLRLGTHRPAQARNAGGVIGSLIASTGNISGAAAPAPSTLAPNLDRPGFNLTRYGYVEEKLSRKGHTDEEGVVRGHHPGVKSLSSFPIESAGTGGGGESDGTELTRFATAPAGSGSVLPDGTRPLSLFVAGTHAAQSEPGSPSNGSTSQLGDPHPHIMAHTPVSAYIPAPNDYFSSPNGSMEPTPAQSQSKSTPGYGHGKQHSGGATTPGGTPFSSIAKRAKWTGVLKDIPGAMHLPSYGGKSGKSTPATTPGSTPTVSERGDWLDGWTEKEKESHEKEKRRREKEKKEKRKRKKAELFITRHVAQIIQRQEFICKLARSMMMFGGPGHRLTAQIQATARVLDLELSCMYLPDVLLISFEDPSTGTSLIKFIKQGSALNLGKLSEGYVIYWKVIHDDMSVSDASASLDKLMRRPPRYKWWHLMIIGGFCSAAICTVSFAGSFIDSLAVFPFGAILVGVQQLSVRNELYSNVFEITIATLFSFICGCLAASKKICYSAAASSSIVLILPGFIVLSGGLEILSRNIVAGSVRLCYAVVYCLFLGFGLAMGAEAFQEITGSAISNLSDTACTATHDANGPWWQRSPSKFWAFLTVPLYSLVLSMRNHQPLFSREMLICVIISCIGWVTTYFVGLKFTDQSDFASAVGAFAIGMISNLSGRFLNGNAFTIMITGILFQVPSGLGNNGLLVFVSQQTDSSSNADAYLSGFDTSLQLISVAIGLTIGLGIALFLSHPIPSRRRAGGVFSL